MRTRYHGPDSGADGSDPKLQRIAAEEMEAARNSAWAEVDSRAAQVLQILAQLLSVAGLCARRSGNLYVAIDHAARKAAMNQVSLQPLPALPEAALHCQGLAAREKAAQQMLHTT